MMSGGAITVRKEDPKSQEKKKGTVAVDRKFRCRLPRLKPKEEVV